MSKYKKISITTMCLLVLFGLLISIVSAPKLNNNLSVSALNNYDAVFGDTSGVLKPYTKLKVKNDAKNEIFAGWQHLSFIDYFEVRRTDGRLIYDEDGYLDARFHKNGEFTPSDEIIDYEAEIWVKTTLAEYNFNGFLGTVLNSKFKEGAEFFITWDRGEDADDGFGVPVKDRNANNMGSGNYRNNGVNPANEYYKLCDWDYAGSPYIVISFMGTAYWENGWWGGCFDYVKIHKTLSGFMPRARRTWNNTLTAKESITSESNNFYSPIPYYVTASNLNNYVKVNDTRMVPISDKNVLPFKDGFRIAITDEGKTKVSIENTIENNYDDYYCFVDSVMPEISFTYSNTNALSNVKESRIITNTNGAKSQSITGAVFKDQVQINFDYTSIESPEQAFITYNNVTAEIKSGTWLNNAGNYTLYIQDKAGNSKTYSFTIDNLAPTLNFEKLSNNTSYKVSKWFVATLPNTFVNNTSQSFENYNDALLWAKSKENENLVTEYYLNDLNDFHYTNLVASGDSVKLGPYWYYKSIENANLYVYYFDETLLDRAITQYSKDYISGPLYYDNSKYNNYGKILNTSMYHNTWNEANTPALIANNFIFTQTDANESYKIYYKAINQQDTKYKELQYNITLKNQGLSHGLYEIKETDFAGHSTVYNIFIDNNAPLLNVQAKVYGTNSSFTHTISQNDIPSNGELVFYYEEFSILDIFDDDTWYVLKIVTPQNETFYYSGLDTLPTNSFFETGQYTITTYDRLNNYFSFMVNILGQAPKVNFETINANQQLKITIQDTDSVNALTDIKIYKNDVLLNSELGFDEYPEQENNDLIFINISTKEYTFNKGGYYKVQLTDVFGRIITYEFAFEKDLPTGILKGVSNNGATNATVSFTYNNTKFLAVLHKNDIATQPVEIVNDNLTEIIIQAESDVLNRYKILLYDKTDFDNFNTYIFDINTLIPEFELIGVSDKGTTSSNVYAKWETLNNYSAVYIFNGNEEQSYYNGQIFTSDGYYEIIVKDRLGNTNSKTFTIDKSLDYIIYVDDEIITISEILYTNRSIKIVNNEPLSIEILKDNEALNYKFNEYFNDEGKYKIHIFDEYGNSNYFEFEIDRTPPAATLIGVANNGTTNSSVQVIWDEYNLLASYYLNEVLQGSYSNGNEIKLNGNYKIVVSDLAGNAIEFNFKIDNELEFEINTFNGGISNEPVRILAYEPLTIEIQKDGQKIDYAFEEFVSEDGFYEFVLTDELGNKSYFEFTILNHPINRLEHKLDAEYSVLEIIKNDKIQELNIQNNTLYLIDEATYKITIQDDESKTYEFTIIIDTTAPTIVLVGVENNGYTKGEVSTRTPSENPIIITATLNDEKLEYTLGDKLESVGNYKLIVSDLAGNITEYEFTILPSLNAATIALFGGMLAVVVLIIILLVKNKVGYYKGKTEITVTEETKTTESIDSIEKK